MSTRTFSALAAGVCLLLAGCEVRKESEQAAAGESLPADDGTLIACALDGAQRFERRCAVEKAEVEGTLFLTVRHPDGAFRRFEVLKDGRGLAAADGADDARLIIEGEFLEADVGDDRYLFPATIGGSGERE